ncbi:MAG: hypothetical protein BWK80_50995 [Desulfobacteraceae bacterium IS3]|nr:MAG: hypothetical protein BWK80_50995 [Desulfobacteraceae bacterium IS3]
MPGYFQVSLRDKKIPDGPKSQLGICFSTIILQKGNPMELKQMYLDKLNFLVHYFEVLSLLSHIQ